ncbi:MAG TPA: hypothetical protein VND91_00300 [Candidatus Saccharimonadia bacterium]|nr:hypothetical protein [Candidatus Saccharimonadia bacterium]
MNEHGVALQERINRIAADLSASTGKPLSFWLEETARMIAGDRRWKITEAEQGPRLEIEEAGDAQAAPDASAVSDGSSP